MLKRSHAVFLIFAALLSSCAPKRPEPTQSQGSGASSATFKALTFRVTTDASTPALMSRVVFVMKARLKAADIRGTVSQGHNGYVQVTVYANSPEPYTSRLLSARGNVTFKIFPKGAIYRPTSERVITSAKVERSYGIGEEQITFAVADPRSFSDFTRSHLNERLGIYIDTRLIIAPTLMGPMGETGEIVGGNFDPKELRFIAAILNSGPLPAPVEYISSAAIVSS